MNKYWIIGIICCVISGMLIGEFTGDLIDSFLLIGAIYTAILGFNLMNIGGDR